MRTYIHEKELTPHEALALFYKVGGIIQGKRKLHREAEKAACPLLKFLRLRNTPWRMSFRPWHDPKRVP